MQNKHSVFSPSASDRWLNCTASYLATKGIEDKTSIYAREGTYAHSVLEYYVKHRSIDYTLVCLSEFYSQELLSAILLTQEYLDTLIEKSTLVLIEKNFLILNNPTEIRGTADYIVIKDKCLHVADFKYGKGRKVPVESNSQLKLYAWGAYQVLKHITTIEKIKLHIMQPRVGKGGNFISCYQNIEELESWIENTVKVKIKEALTGGVYKDGSWCWFCKVKDSCVYIIQKDYIDTEDCKWRDTKQ